MMYCVDEKHAVPCPQPCDGCLSDCDTDAIVEATNPSEAARLAGWSDGYIQEILLAGLPYEEVS